MEKKVLLLGYGMQGKAALYDLAKCDIIGHITVVDNQPDFRKQLKNYSSKKVKGEYLDVTDIKALSFLMREFDVVVEALPGPFALPIGQLAAKNGVNLVSCMYYIDPGELDPKKIETTKKQFDQIDQHAKKKGVTILSEFGLDPGLDIILGAKAIKEMDSVEELNLYGAGIPGPNARNNPLNYKFSWYIMGVMDAYHRPASIISSGQEVILDATQIFEKGNYHLLEVEEIGSPLECYINGNSVYYAELLGIRDTVKEMGRYTCRLPGHCAFWETMVKCGFLDEKPIKIKDASISPVQFTASLLSSQQQFFYSGDEQDMTFLRVDARGICDGKRTKLIYDMIDERDLVTGFTSMQRTVGFTLSLGAQLILEGKLDHKGLLTPLDVPYELVIPSLEKPGIRIVRKEIPLDLKAKD
jgi:lysine 6-dehydrogenase